MAHLLRSILYPPECHPNHLNPPPIVDWSSSSNPSQRRRRGSDSASGGAGGQLQHGIGGSINNINNPPVFFNQDPEIDQPALSGFVADSMLGGFDLNQDPPQSSGFATHMHHEDNEQEFVPGPHSAASDNAANGGVEEGEEICSQPVVPYVGMIFDDLEEAAKVYNDYAWKLGFGVRIGNTKYSTAKNAPPGTILNRVFECVHQGKPSAHEDKVEQRTTGIAAKGKDAAIDLSSFSGRKSRSRQAGVQMDVKDSRQRNRLIRHDCKAHMHVSNRKGVCTVTVFTEEHTHPMVKQIGRRRYYRSHRKVPEEDFQFLQTLHQQNINTAKIMGCLGSVHGGDPRCLGYVKKDVSNIRTMLRQEVSERDMKMVIEYFEKRQAESPHFFYATLQDKTKAIRGLFWVDGRTRAMYPKYKDCVFFDTTFCTNRYNMPFAPIVGINNHTHTVVLGCALLPDETVETFEWVFGRWKLAMEQGPDHIMTDQDKQMATAISNVFPDSVHRCCLYHVLGVARKKLGPLLVDGNPFTDAFYSCIYGTDTVDQFEYCWQHMLQSFAMAENTHLCNMWNSRKTWAPVYFRKNFFPFTSTTGRSEGLNSYFKTLIQPSDSVYNFVQQYELCQNLMLDREDNAGFTMEATIAPLWGSYPMEKQSLNFYTREVFERFQLMIKASTRFYPRQVEGDVLCFDLVPNEGLDVKTYRVEGNVGEGMFTCGCNAFEMCGLICPHIIRVMVQLNVREIPSRYMLERWSSTATIAAPDPGTNTIRFGVPPTNTLRYNALCRKMNNLASDACFNNETYGVVSSMIDEATKVVAAMRKAQHNVQQEDEGSSPREPQPETYAQDVAGSSEVQNPPRAKPKGRPKEKEKRRKPLTELRQEANKKRRKKAAELKQPKPPKAPRKYRKKKCPYCGEEGHTVQECKYMKIALQKEAEEAAGVDLHL